MTWKKKFALTGLAMCMVIFFLTGFDLFVRDDPALLKVKPYFQEHLSRFGIGAEKDPDKEYKNTVKAVPKYVAAILDPKDKKFNRLECPRPDLKRYEHLIPASTNTTAATTKRDATDVKPKYIFALNLINIVHLLPRLMGSIMEATEFLGVENCMITIVEGHSTDGTMEVLEALKPEAEKKGVEYHFLRSDITPRHGHRIERLAELRNLALEPLLSKPDNYAEDPVIIFLNDVAICLEDILELMHQQVHLGADMTCAMDWSHLKAHPTFYDVWVARAITGNSFFYIDPKEPSWIHATDLFFDDPEGRARFDNHQPVQVFACWNGAVVFPAKPLLKDGIRFRGVKENECRMGEPTYLNKDMWHKGYGKIAVVPTVNIEYDDDHGKWIKEQKGYVSSLLPGDDGLADLLAWKPVPEKVLCMPGWRDQTWRAWDDSIDQPPKKYKPGE